MSYQSKTQCYTTVNNDSNNSLLSDLNTINSQSVLLKEQSLDTSNKSWVPDIHNPFRSKTKAPKFYLPEEEEYHKSNNDFKHQLDTDLNSIDNHKQVDHKQERQQWSSPVEFLMSCLAMSVGLGNVWRFPMTAYNNGGGAFLIPYLIVLIFIGRPLYFMELGLGQFSSYGCVKIWKCAPAFKGVGYGQLIATWSVVTYYVSLMAITVFYFTQSFQSVLPWTVCDPAWANMSTCVSAQDNFTLNDNPYLVTSSEQYFENYVLRQPQNLHNGPGLPDWRLTLCLAFSWIVLFITLVKGVQSSGKVAYFTAIFPYIVLVTLLIRGVTLPGAWQGIMYFIIPQWSKLLDPNVWYAAVTQSFFSLSVGFGSVTMFSSYNNFSHNIYRDAWIISLADTMTSLLAGVTIFSILGNLQHETQATDISEVVKASTGLAFISYPTAIAKFSFLPQIFSVLFFLMLFTLGVGTAAALTGCVITVICDQMPSWKRSYVTAAICMISLLIGLIYVTPGGMYIVDLVDFYGGGFIIFLLAVLETVAIHWVYGLNKFCNDMKFMLGIDLGIYWKFCWGFFIPVGLSGILVYALVDFNLPTYNGDLSYPPVYYLCGWLLSGLALLMVLIGFGHSFIQHKGHTVSQKFLGIFQPKATWGPRLLSNRREWSNLN